MKFVEDVFPWIVIVAIFWPWGIALADLAFWMVTGATTTSIPWRESRGTMMILWPVVGVVAVVVLGGLSG